MKKKRILIEDLVWQTDKGSTCLENCWCRRIVTVPTKSTRQRQFLSEGWITQEQADLIVKIHNEWLKYKKGLSL